MKVSDVYPTRHIPQTNGLRGKIIKFSDQPHEFESEGVDITPAWQ